MNPHQYSQEHHWEHYVSVNLGDWFLLLKVDFDLFNLTSVEDLQLVIELTEIQQMQSKESFSQFEHKVFTSKLNGLIEVKSACSSLPFS
jgi:hypothetical protein